MSEISLLISDRDPAHKLTPPKTFEESRYGLPIRNTMLSVKKQHSVLKLVGNHTNPFKSE